MTKDVPEPKEETIGGRDVFVARDETGVAAVSEDKDSADPRVTASDDDEDQDEAQDSAQQKDSD